MFSLSSRIEEGNLLDPRIGRLSVILYYEHVQFEITLERINNNTGINPNLHVQVNFINDCYELLVKNVLITHIIFGYLGQCIKKSLESLHIDREVVTVVVLSHSIFN